MTFVEAVRNMRDKQKAHERVMSQSSLTEKREAEEEVDRQLKAGVVMERPSKKAAEFFTDADGRLPLIMRPSPWSKTEFQNPVMPVPPEAVR